MHPVHVSAPFRARCTGSLSEGVGFPVGNPTPSAVDLAQASSYQLPKPR